MQTRPEPRTISCPSCGAGRTLHNPGLVMFVCDYCSNAVHWDNDAVHAAGKQALLSEGCSRLYRGAMGSYHNKRFHVLGRVRYSFGEGFWDEWFLELDDDSTCWMSEDQHQLSVQRKIDLKVSGKIEHYRVGNEIAARDSVFVVQEIGNAECIGIEGELPEIWQVGETYPYINATSLEGHYSLGIELDDDPPTVFLGKWLKYKEVKLDDDGDAW